MLNVLIVYAVEEEHVHVNMPNCIFHYCHTGVGKISAAIAVERCIQKHKPDVVLNIGTAGTVKYDIGTVHLCCRFIDRDMEKLQNFGVPYEEDFTNEIKTLGFFNDWKFDSICNTGDTFLTSADGTGDVFDMESFAVAKVCKQHKLPFVSVKCVTDIIGQNSIKHWEEKLAEAQGILQKFVNENSLFVPDDFISSEVKKLIDKYEMQSHPEGGWFKESYRSDLVLKENSLPSCFNGDRNSTTSIYYLLTNKTFSAFHRIQSPEVWYFHKGMPLLIHMINKSGEYFKIELSDKESGVLQYTVERNIWFAAELKEGYGYGFVGCSVSPGFDFQDFKLAAKSDMLTEFPHHKLIIDRMCKG